MTFEGLNLTKVMTVLVLLFFFSPYLGIVPFAYGIILLAVIPQLQKVKLTYYDYAVLLILFIFFGFKFYQVSFSVWDALVRYYFGIIILYLFIKVYEIKLDAEMLISILFWVVLFEAFIINTFINPFQYLPNYPRSVFDLDIAGHYTKFMGFYQRPYSIGMNASTASTITCALLMYRATEIHIGTIKGNKRVELYGLATVLLFASGVGLSLYFFYVLYRTKLITVKRALILIGVLVILFTGYDKIIGFFAADSIFQKVSAAYMGYLVDFKIEQVDDVLTILKDPKNSLWIGQAFAEKAEIIIQSDFAWNDFIQCFGILGPVLYLTFISNKINSFNVAPILLLLIGAFHYGGVFTLPGQIVFGFILINLSKKTLALKLNVNDNNPNLRD